MTQQTQPRPAELVDAATEALVNLELEATPDARAALDDVLTTLAEAGAILRRVPPAPAGAGPDAELTAALAAAQAAFPPIDKRHTAKVKSPKGDYSYTYADLADVLNAVRPVLAAHGLAVTQQTQHQPNATVLLTTALRHVAGGVLTSEIEIGQLPGNPQQFGGALTYLRRYELVTLLGIAAEEDRDAQDVEPTRYGQPAAMPAPPEWTLEADRTRKAEFLDLLEPLLGRDAARALATATRDTFGVLPDGIVGYTKALVAYYHAVNGTPDAARAAAAQDQAAEQPDPPTPDTDVPAPPPSDFTPDEPAAAPAGFEPATDPTGGKPAADVLAELETDRASAGLTTTKADKVARLRELGCVCPKPLDKTPELDASCPFVDHGIPF